jgi:transposase
MGTTRRKFTCEFKMKVVLEAFKERNTIQELATKYEIHPQQITDWKRQFLDNSEAAF